MSSPDAPRLPEPRDGERPAPMFSRIKDWGDRLCCGALTATALIAFAGICWFVWQMPSLR